MAWRPRCAHCNRAFAPNYRVRKRRCPWDPESRFQRFCAQTPECRTASRKFTQAEYRSREPEDPAKMKMRRLKSRRVLREARSGALASGNNGPTGVLHPVVPAPSTRSASLRQDGEVTVPEAAAEDVDEQLLAARIRRESAGIAQLLLATRGRDI